MKFVAKQIPEGINTSADHPLKELFILLLGAGFFVALAFLVLVLMSDFLVRYIPVDTERQWFSESRLSFLQRDTPADEVLHAEQYLAQLVERLAPPDSNPDHYTIRLMEGDEPNAFITPGGHIFVTTELLRFVNSENALAMVVAHEMAHQIHRHPIRSMGRGIVIAVALMIFAGVDGSQWVSEILAETINLGLLAYSRDQEREADQTGLKLLTDYYGHAAGSSYFFSQLNQQDKFRQTGLSEYLSTHPNTDERLAFLQQYDSDDNAPLTPLPVSIQRLQKSGTESAKMEPETASR